MCPTDYVTDTGMPELRSLMGVQLGFMGVQLGCKVILAVSWGLRAVRRELPGTSWKTLSSLPDDGAPHAGTATWSRRAALSCSPFDRRFRRSDARSSLMLRQLRRCSLVEMPGRAPRFVLSWTGDRSPFR